MPAMPPNSRSSSAPAFPSPIHQVEMGLGGITKREYFAAAALHGLLSNPQDSEMGRSIVCVVAVEIADLLIQSLDSNPPSTEA